MEIKNFACGIAVVALGVFLCDCAEEGVSYIHEEYKQYKKYKQRSGRANQNPHHDKKKSENDGFNMIHGRRAAGFTARMIDSQ